MKRCVYLKRRKSLRKNLRTRKHGTGGPLPPLTEWLPWKTRVPVVPVGRTPRSPPMNRRLLSTTRPVFWRKVSGVRGLGKTRSRLMVLWPFLSNNWSTVTIGPGIASEMNWILLEAMVVRPGMNAPPFPTFPRIIWHKIPCIRTQAQMVVVNTTRRPLLISIQTQSYIWTALTMH